MTPEPMTPADEATITSQLGRPPRGVVGIAWRCVDGHPGVVVTEPRLPDGTPFPTMYYLTCPALTSAVSTLEASGLMAEMADRLAAEADLAAAYRDAHEAYLADRGRLGGVPEIEGISAGGMPSRVKCLHVLAAHALAAGPGVNPLGDEVVARLRASAHPCLKPEPEDDIYAAVDCGTNSIRLLVCRDVDGRLVEVDRRLHLTRLGQGVDATGRFHPDALARTFAAMADFGAQLDDFGVPAAHRRVVATSAARDAANSAEFFAGALARLGVDAEIIAGEEEARLSYAGAVTALPGLAQPVLVMDIGGGSTELVSGSGGVPSRAVSLDAGSVRLRERFLHSDPPTREEIAAARDYVDSLLDGCGIDFEAVASWVGVGGTATSLSALALGLPVYDRSLVHGSVLSRDALASLTTRLLAMPVAEVVALPTMVPGRADVICAGALICSAVADRVDRELVVSEADILDGIVRSLAG